MAEVEPDAKLRDNSTAACQALCWPQRPTATAWGRYYSSWATAGLALRCSPRYQGAAAASGWLASCMSCSISVSPSVRSWALRSGSLPSWSSPTARTMASFRSCSHMSADMSLALQVRSNPAASFPEVALQPHAMAPQIPSIQGGPYNAWMVASLRS